MCKRLIAFFRRPKPLVIEWRRDRPWPETQRQAAWQSALDTPALRLVDEELDAAVMEAANATMEANLPAEETARRVQAMIALSAFKSRLKLAQDEARASALAAAKPAEKK